MLSPTGSFGALCRGACCSVPSKGVGFTQVSAKKSGQYAYQYELADTLCIHLPGPPGPGLAAGRRDELSKAVELSQRLETTWPWVNTCRALWANALAKYGVALNGAGELAAAEEACRGAVDKFAALNRAQGAPLSYTAGYVRAAQSLAGVLQQQGRPAEARDVLEGALETMGTRSGRRHPVLRGLQMRLYRSIESLGQ